MDGRAWPITKQTEMAPMSKGGKKKKKKQPISCVFCRVEGSRDEACAYSFRESKQGHEFQSR